jgi:2'-5' RNA ligase
MRTFIAIELAPDLKRPLVRMLRDLPRADGVRWVTDQQLHLTLKFLGEVGDTVIGKVCEAAAKASAAVDPFEIRVAGLGVFPAPRNPRVLWCGIEDADRGCQRWVQAVDPLLADLGFKPETRAFAPHVTLGRSRSTAGAGALRDVLDNTPPPDTPTMRVKRVVVFESQLRPSGAVYNALATVALGAV